MNDLAYKLDYFSLSILVKYLDRITHPFVLHRMCEDAIMSNDESLFKKIVEKRILDDDDLIAFLKIYMYNFNYDMVKFLNPFITYNQNNYIDIMLIFKNKNFPMNVDDDFESNNNLKNNIKMNKNIREIMKILIKNETFLNYLQPDIKNLFFPNYNPKIICIE
jgi:hypothetical protein